MRTDNSLLKQKYQLLGRIEELCHSIDNDLRHIVETYFEKQGEVYFELEEKLLRLTALFETIHNQVREAKTRADVRRTAERVNYVADCLEEIEIRIYPRRRRKKRSFFDFFTRYQEQQGNPKATLQEAYAELELKEDASLFEAATMFRRLVKKYHPDARGGDRSQEAALRRIVRAYQYIKEHFAQTTS